ncbi:hypothetical protein PHMEG_00013530 [Phytophthora megakarya]|uniref:Jacalin-type lectin domain-containing protein n=1 Tax=Phytophthora megakarya TaxID=4795 RepID=A0A225W622_9STRA|nr:hypothetical protein PHMEG_00013530 [Phytophthora megakarya]
MGLSGHKSTLKHGGGGGDKNTLTLSDGEHVTGMEVHWGKYYRKTRVMYIKFTTNKGNAIDGGTPQDNTDKIALDNAQEGYQLGGFVGFAGKELDSVGPVWTSITPVVGATILDNTLDQHHFNATKNNPTSDGVDTEERRGAVGGGRGRGGAGRGGLAYSPGGGNGGVVTATEPPVQPLPAGVYLGTEFGGYYGKEYSDVGLVMSGQKVLSVNIRAGERVDAVELNIVSPSGEESTLYHGGNGGNLKIPLALATGEYITGIEAHAGNHKDNNETDTAKDGYQLGGFIGSSGDELDLVGAIWTSIQLV